MPYAPLADVDPDQWDLLQVTYVFNQFTSDKDEIADFLATLGVDRTQFLRQFESAETDRMVRNTMDLRSKYDVSYTPSVMVDGRYMTSAELAGNDMTRLTNIVDALVAKVRAEAL